MVLSRQLFRSEPPPLPGASAAYQTSPLSDKAGGNYLLVELARYHVSSFTLNRPRLGGGVKV
jgi:hypothetical protein